MREPITSAESPAPEEWRTIAEFPDYEVSNHGRVRRGTPGRSTWPGRIRQQQIDHGGYSRINLPRNGAQTCQGVHRLVAIAFIGDPPDDTRIYINHIDGRKTHNIPENLEWVTALENHRHAEETGLRRPQRSEDNYNSKLTNRDVATIRTLLANGSTGKDVAERFGVSHWHVSRINTGARRADSVEQPRGMAA